MSSVPLLFSILLCISDTPVMNTFVLAFWLMSVPVLATISTLVSGCRNLNVTVPEAEVRFIVALLPEVAGSDTTKSIMLYW